MIESFPVGAYDPKSMEDANPSIKAFGRRFSDDQQNMELLSEFLLVAHSRKKRAIETIDAALPSPQQLKNWREEPVLLSYFPKARLNLKLFAFLSASKLSTRHETHREHAEQLWGLLAQKTDLITPNEQNEFLKTLAQLLLGFWGNGSNRAWCAQTFFPFCPTALCAETIWNETTARKQPPDSWEDVCAHFTRYFDMNRHRVLARGGEALYLQVCNALSRSQGDLEQWFSRHTIGEVGLGLTGIEASPEKLHHALLQDFAAFFSATPKMLHTLMEFIDTGVEDETAKASDEDDYGNPRGTKCGWTPLASWREGYLFAVEVHRILSAKIGLVEKVDLLQICCALQVMRSLAAQSYRFSQTPGGDETGFDYRVFLSDADSQSRKSRSLSSRALAEITREIQQAIHIPEIEDDIRARIEQKANPQSEYDKIYKEADTYGFKLYRKIGKSLGLIVPPKGKQMRCTLNDRLLKYLIVATVPGRRITLDSFKRQVELHHGFVFEPPRLRSSRNWAEVPLESSGDDGKWLERMLEASGVLVKLSDACALVKNPYAAQTLNREG